MRIGYSFFLVLIMVLLSACAQSRKEANDRPNFIIIQMDDLGFSDLSLHDNPYIRTPNIDNLGNNGLQFENFYVNAVCAPSRASLLTGRHFLRTGVSHVHGGKEYLHLNERTFADRLTKEGYATGFWGKWHSGQSDGYYPWQRGFSEAWSFRLYQHEEASGLHNGEPFTSTQWADTFLVNGAIEFISNHKDTPFLAYLSTMSCHEPLRAPEKTIEKYRNRGLPENLSTLYAMVDYFDRQMGRLIDYLEKEGLLESTVILFLSDNGPAVNNRSFSDAERQLRKVKPYKGWKGNLWENGVKSPLFIYWKGKIKPGRVSSLANITDLYPTLLDLAHIPVPKDQLPLDGKSLAPFVFGNGEMHDERMVLDYVSPGWPPTKEPWTPEGVKEEYLPMETKKRGIDPTQQILSIRRGKYKLIQNPGPIEAGANAVGNLVLIDIDQDPFETTNVISEHPQVASELQRRLNGWFEEIKQSPQAFTAPLNQLSLSHHTLPIYNAFNLSVGLKEGFAFVHNWKNTGQHASFKINVLEPFLAYPSLQTYGGDSLRQDFALVTPGDSVFIGRDTVDLMKGKQEWKLVLVGSQGNPGRLRQLDLLPVKPVRAGRRPQ